jgi:hypothetical protein
LVIRHTNIQIRTQYSKQWSARVCVPLSEEEQKLLEEIERNFYESDPTLANTVRSTTVYTDSRRRAVIGVIALCGGLALVVVGLSSHVIVSYVGFVVMLGGAFVLEQYLRRIGRAGIQAFTGRLTAGTVRQSLSDRQGRNRPDLRRRRTDADSTDES